MAWHYPLLSEIAAAARHRGRRGPVQQLVHHRALDAALAAAWATAGPGGQARITALQLTRGTPAALQNLVAHAHRLTPSTRDVLLERIADLHPALRLTLNRHRVTASGAAPTQRAADAQPLINALWLIEHGDATALAYLALPSLRHADPAVRDAAERCLCGMARATHPAARSRPPRAATALGEALQDAVCRFASHRHPGALRAWAALGTAAFDPAGRALAALQHPEHPAVAPLRRLLKDADTPETRAGLVGLLGTPNTALAAVAGLRRCAAQGPGTLAQALHGRAHLLDLPAVRQGLARGGDAQELWIPPPGPDHPETEAWTLCDALPAWAAALPGSPAQTLARLGPLTATGSRERRLDALRRVTALITHLCVDTRLRHTVEALLVPLAADPDPVLAGPAATALMALARPRATARGRGFTPPPPPSSHPAATPPVFAAEHCRRAATRRAAATAFEPLWHSWSRLPPNHRRRAAAAALRLDPSARSRLCTALDARDPDVRQRAHAIARTLAAR